MDPLCYLCFKFVFSLNFYFILYKNMCTYNTIRSHTDHFEIQKKEFRRKSIDFYKSVSQLFNIRNTINVWLELT